MISREDFMFTTGYQGNTAIVDGSSKRRFGKMGVEELTEKGMFKPALCRAVYDDDEGEKAKVLDLYNSQGDKKIESFDDLKKVLGVTKVPEEIEKTMVI